MPRFVNCDDPDFPEYLETDICSICRVKWEISAVFCGLLLALEFFMLYRWKYRNHKTLLTFHNLRSALTLLLLAINSLEVARAFLPWPDAYNNNNDNNNNNNSSSNNNTVRNNNMLHNTGNGYGNRVVVAEANEVGGVIVLSGSAINLPLPVINYEQENEEEEEEGEVEQKNKAEDRFNDDIVIIIVGSSTLLNALLATMLTLLLLSYHRVVELKNTVVFLYVSATIEILISILRVYEFSEIAYYGSYFELEACLQAFTAVCLLGLGITDGYTIHKERYRPVYYEDYEKIGYKHTLATFYSKACFWWLTPLLWFGYKEPLELEDLGQMRVEDSARAYYDRFLLIYKTAKVLETDPPPSLWLCYLVSSWRMFTLGGLLKLFGDLFALIGPLAIQQIVQYIECMYSTLPGAQLEGHHKPQQQHSMYNDSSNNQSNSSIILQGLEYLHNRSIRAAGSITSTGNPYSNNSFNNSIYNNSISNYNNDGNGTIFFSDYNAIANGVDDDGYYNGAEVQIYYATWLDLVSNGWAIAWIVLLAALAQGGLSQASTHILNMTGIRIKTSLQGLIYRKTLLLNSNCINVDSSNKNKINNVDEKHHQMPQKPPLGDDAATENVKNIEVTLKSSHLKNESFQSKNVENSKENGAGSNSASDGDTRTDAGTIINLMSEDTLNIMSFFWIAHYVWAIPVKIAVVMFLLYLKLGISAVIGSFVCILTLTPLQFLIGKAMSRNTEEVAKHTDERLRKIHDTICGIKLIKLNAWDDVFLRKIRAAREKELHYLNRDSIYWTLMTILTHISTVLITFVTLAVYVRLEDGNSEFTASRLFSALALFQQLTVPLLIFPITVPIILSAVVSTRRIERFLLCAEIKKEFQGIRNMARILSRSDASLDMYEEQQPKPPLFQNDDGKDTVLVVDSTVDRADKKLKLRMPSHMAPLAQSEPQSPLTLIDVDAPVFTFHPPSPSSPAVLRTSSPPNLSPLAVTASAASAHIQHKRDNVDCNECKRHVLLRKTPYVLIRPRTIRSRNISRSLSNALWVCHRDSMLLKMPEGVAVSLRKACFAWNPRSMLHTLTVSEIEIPRGKFSIIVGKNGSGKSSLLSALLMEMPHISGDFIWNKTSTIAYVPQQPWLLNASIRQNILFGEHFRPKRYEFVLEACALKSDIEIMPDGDLTIIGERGINLSGGQRQRVNIARALYSSANVVLMDDPLSSLDNEVARHVFEQSIRKMLLKANRTVILVTQQLNLVHQADYIIVMKDGHLQAAGSYKNIEAEHPNIVKKWHQIIARSHEKEEHSSAIGRTARERWKLFKNVTKLGLQRSVSTLSGTSSVVASLDIDEATAENDTMSMDPSHHIGHTSNSFRLRPKRSSVYGSRHLIYDVPLPIDECQTDDVIIRRQRPRRASSRSSSQRSTSSINSSELRRSLLTASCSSAASYASSRQSNSNNNNNTAEIEAAKVPISPPVGCSSLSGTTISQAERTQRGQSWQPQTTASNLCHHHKKEKENEFQTAWVAAMADGLELQEERRAENMGSFQQFMRRMSMRQSNKSKTNRLHRPVSATNSILSISEESASLPSIELGSVATESSSWIANIEDEEPIPDAHIDYEDTLQQQQRQLQQSKQQQQHQLKLQQEEQRQSSLKNLNGFGASSTTTLATTNTTTTAQTPASLPSISPDVERKYGKIPAKIYLLYLRASGYPIVLTFFTAALIWQCLRIYTDVWLQHWTDDKGMLEAVVTSVGGIQANTTSASTTNDGSSTLTSFAMHTIKTTSTFKIDSMDEAAAAAIDDNALLSPTTMQHEVTYYFHVYALISCVCILMALISTPAGQMAGCSARRNLHDQLLTAIMGKSLHFFQVSPLGRIMNRFGNDMAIIDKKIAATSQRLLQFTLLCLCAVLINVTITPWFILLTVPICTAYYAIQKFYRCSSRELQRIENFTNTPVISHLSETIQGVTTIRAYNQEARFTEILFRRLEANTIAFTILNTSNRWLGISLDYLGGVIVFVAVVIALLAANISYSNLAVNNILSNHNSSNNIKNFKDISAAAIIDPTTTTPSPSASLVGLAINYTLLVPIYLNWVVKLLADMEMYIGSVERIAYYTEASSGTKTKRRRSENVKETETAAGRTAAHAANECRTNDGKSTVATMTSKTMTKTTAATATAAKRTMQEAAAAQLEINDDDVDVPGDRRTHQKHQHRHIADNGVCANDDNNDNDDDDTDVGANDGAKFKSVLVVGVDNGATATGTANDVSHDVAVAVSDGSDVDAADKLLVVDDEIFKFADASKAVVDRTAAVNARITREDQSATTTTTTTTSKTKADTLSCQMERNDVERTPTNERRVCNGTIYKKVPISWPQRGDISFENVSLRYEGQQKDVITNLTLKIPAGQRIGICGRTGSGKSSLALSLFGVLQTTGGRTLIDDVDITQIHPDEIRSRLSIIPQDVHLFNATIRENLDPPGYYSDLALWNCLELAQLKEIVNNEMPQGLDTEILDGGINLSLGHRQLFCLARAILRGSVCLVLDEATSSLDSSTERELLDAAHRAFQGRTILTIAHRLSTILNYDRIIVMENGKIIEDGSPQQLQQKKDGAFYSLLHSGRSLSMNREVDALQKK